MRSRIGAAAPAVATLLVSEGSDWARVVGPMGGGAERCDDGVCGAVRAAVGVGPRGRIRGRG
jgi:hypothetical protein